MVERLTTNQEAAGSSPAKDDFYNYYINYINQLFYKSFYLFYFGDKNLNIK